MAMHYSFSILKGYIKGNIPTPLWIDVQILSVTN